MGFNNSEEVSKYIGGIFEARSRTLRSVRNSSIPTGCRLRFQRSEAVVVVDMPNKVVTGGQAGDRLLPRR